MVFKCQEDSFLKEFSSTVVSCEKIDDEKDLTSKYQVVLEDTILFPEGGGQPCDYGSLNNHSVSNVIRKGALAIHFVESTEKPFEPGQTVLQKVDWDRRTDHMQQHSGQHLISSLFDTECQIPTKSWWLGKFGETSYVELNAKDITQEQIDHVESICNSSIANAVPVTVKVYDPKDPALSEDVLRIARGIPDDVVGPIRVVNIHGIDSNPCCGTHVRNLSQLQAIKILNVEKTKNKLLLHFLVGGRVLKKLTECYQRELQLNLLLKGGPASHLDLTKKLQASLKASQRTMQRLAKDVAAHEAEKFNVLPEKPKYYSLHQNDGVDGDFISVFLRNVKGAENTFLFMTVGDETLKGQLVLQGPPVAIAELGQQICEKLDGKGNGKNNKFQAKVNNLKKVKDCEQIIKDYFNKEE